MNPEQLQQYVYAQEMHTFWASTTGPFMPAIRMAKRYHADQLYGEESYIAHLFYVMSFMATLNHPDNPITEEHYVLALLHDCYEDAKDKFPDILDTIFLCYGQQMVENVRLISKNKGESHSDYYERLGDGCNHVVATVKACDRYANCTYGALRRTPKQERYWKEYPELRENIRPFAHPDSIATLDDWYFDFLKATGR